MNKKFLTLLLGAAFALSFLGSANMAAASISTNQANYTIGIVYSTGGLGDQSFNDAAKVGIDAAVAEHGTALEVIQSCESGCTTIPDVTQAIIDMGDRTDKTFDLIIGVGFSAFDGINASATAHPDTNYMIIDSVVDLANVHSVVFKEQEGSFLAGAMAAMTSQTHKIAFLGGLDIELINRFLAGYADGAAWIAKETGNATTVAATYSPDPSNPWGDIDGGKRVGQAFIDAGYDIVYSAAGGTGLGAIDAVAEANTAAGSSKYFAIGVDSNQDGASKGDVLTSMIKRVDVAVKNDIDAIVADSWKSGTTALGLAENGVGISDMQYTQAEADAMFNSTKTRMQVIEGLTKLIVRGDIVVKSLKSEVTVKDFSLPTSQNSGDTIPLPNAGLFLGFLASIAVIVRRRE